MELREGRMGGEDGAEMELREGRMGQEWSSWRGRWRWYGADGGREEAD